MNRNFWCLQGYKFHESVSECRLFLFVSGTSGKCRTRSVLGWNGLENETLYHFHAYRFIDNVVTSLWLRYSSSRPIFHKESIHDNKHYQIHVITYRRLLTIYLIQISWVLSFTIIQNLYCFKNIENDVKGLWLFSCILWISSNIVVSYRAKYPN